MNCIGKWVQVATGVLEERVHRAPDRHRAPRIVATGCLKTHQFGGIFTLSETAVGGFPAEAKYMRGLQLPHIGK